MLTLLKYKAGVHKSFGGGDRLPVSAPLILRRAEPSVSQSSLTPHSPQTSLFTVNYYLFIHEIDDFYQICSFYNHLEHSSPTKHILLYDHMMTINWVPPVLNF